jgi:aspartyl-tRNA(Asn)/glutamyl-tRNA(Gln) amidotransferase subunit B
VQKAIEHEIARQIAHRRGPAAWSCARPGCGTPTPAPRTRCARKEEADDYRYLPDPDLPPLVVTAALQDGERAALPELPAARFERYVSALGLAEDDARTLCSERALGDYFDAAVAGQPAAAVRQSPPRWMLGELAAALNARRCRSPPRRSPRAASASWSALIADGTISGKIGKEVFEEVVATGAAPADIVEQKGLRQVSDPAALRAIAEQLIADNPKNVASYRAGKTNLLGFFVGGVLKATGGTANPQLVSQIVTELLAKPNA